MTISWQSGRRYFPFSWRSFTINLGGGPLLLRYATEHGGATFKRPARLPLYDKNIADNATTVLRVRAESAHRARLDNYASYEAAKRGAAEFLREVANEVWYNNLKDADTFYVGP